MRKIEIQPRFLMVLFIGATLALLCTHLVASTAREEKIQEGLALVRDGCFKDGEENFRRIIESDGSSPAAYFFTSFSNFIHLIYNPNDSENRAELESNLKRVIELGELKVQTKNDEETRLALGTSYLLKSYYHALNREAFSAALLARKGKKVLESLLSENPQLYDAYFGLGIYNYFADRVPSIVKGIRFLLFLPGGDRKLGLSQLKQASLKSRYFNAESSLILAEIYANRFEKNYYASFIELSGQVDSGNEHLLMLHALAKLHMKILNYETAASLLERALSEAEKKCSDNDVKLYMKFHLAKCYFLMNMADRAIPHFQSIISMNQKCNDELLKETLLLNSQALSLTGQPQRIEEIKKACPEVSKELLKSIETHMYSAQEIDTYRKNLDALELSKKGNKNDAIKMLQENLAHDSASMQTRLLLGMMYLKANDPEAAFRVLNDILISTSPVPKQIKDVAELRSGNCLDLMGKRKTAEEIYRRIILRGNSIAKEAAYFYLKDSFGGV